MFGELVYLLEPLLRPFRRVKVIPAESPRIVMVLPGFATHPLRMRYLARLLERAGHKTKRWGLGQAARPTGGVAGLEPGWAVRSRTRPS